MLHQRLGWRAFLWTIVIVSISQSAQASLNARQTDQAAISSRRGPPFAHNQHQQLVATRHHYHSPNQAQAHFEQPDQDYQNRETYEELLSSSSRSGSSLDNDQLQVQQAPSLQQSARERCRELISLTLLSFKDLSPDERASEEIDCANLREQIAQASSSVNSSSRQLSARQQQRARPGNQFVDPETNSQQNQASVGHHSQNLHLAATQPADEFPLAPIYNRDSAPLRQFNNIQPVSNVSLAENSFIASTSWQPKQQNSYVNQMQQLLILQQQQRQRLQQESLANQQQFDVATTLPPPTTQATTFESLFETTALPATTTTTTSTTTTTTTTTTTPAPIIPKLRVGGNRRKPKQLRTSTTTTTTTTTTQKPSEEIDDASTDYETEPDYESDYTTTTTTTTQRPRHKNQNQKQQRARRPRTSTTPKPTTTTTTLSPGYQPRPDGRIIDYMADPNFPRELKGADLTNYPFYISVPEKIDFECRGRHDGYYANIDLHCQVSVIGKQTANLVLIVVSRK